MSARKVLPQMSAFAALALMTACTVSSATFTPGSDGGAIIPDARIDALVVPDAEVIPDAEVVPDATPVQCSGDGECQTPPTLCHRAGTCDLGLGVCDFAEVDCSGMTDACNVGVCQSATGACAAQPANQGTLCGAGDVLGSFGACSGFTETCDSSGEQSRTNTRNACAAGACVGVPYIETVGCTRSTNDVDCQTDTVTNCGACGGFADTCDESGSQTCTCTDFKCQGDVCTSIATSCAQSCARDTDTTSCGAGVVCGAFGACAGFASGTCDSTGEQSRNCTTNTCQAGACVGVGSVETVACTRVTNGVDCQADTVTACGACGGFATTCDEGGSQTCTCTDFKCQSDVCTAVATSCSQACARDTDGTTCSADTVTGCGACNYSSTCDENAVRTCTCNTFSCASGGCTQASASCQEQCTRVTDGISCGTCTECPRTCSPSGTCTTTACTCP